MKTSHLKQQLKTVGLDSHGSGRCDLRKIFEASSSKLIASPKPSRSGKQTLDSFAHHQLTKDQGKVGNEIAHFDDKLVFFGSEFENEVLDEEKYLIPMTLYLGWYKRKPD